MLGTSKYTSEDVYLGRNGTFLASLAAMSLLTITSHHYEHRSHNSITFHHSKAIERHMPVSAQHEVKYEEHGTRVTVRNLFGNLPVRVKQRAVVVEQRSEQVRLWDILKRDITGLLLGWGRPISLRIQDADHKTVLNFPVQAPPTPNESHTTTTCKRRPDELQLVLSALTQAGYISIDDWISWVPVSASTSSVTIKGAISLEPAPTKRVQFISLGIQPLSSERGHNVLYHEVNRTFGLSDFGIIEDDAQVGESEKIRRQNDKRFKSAGYTNRQLKGRKSVDRYPMFHLHISLKDGHPFRASKDRYLDEQTHLPAVVEVLDAMITQWLSLHCFRPRKRRTERYRLGTASTSITGSTEQETSQTQLPFDQSGLDVKSSMRNSAESRSRKRKRTLAAMSANRVHQSAFNDWSRIKSGKSEFHGGLWASTKRKETLLAEDCSSNDFTESENMNPSIQSTQRRAMFDAEPILPGSLNASVLWRDATKAPTCNTSEPVVNDGYDESMIWTNFTNMQALALNTRTGSEVPHDSLRPQTSSSIKMRPNGLNEYNNLLRIRKRTSSIEETSTPWLDGLLKAWDNPVFKVTETRIPQACIAEHELGCGCHSRAKCFHHSRGDMDRAFNDGTLACGTSKMSKEGLRGAQVIAQLDRKFILVKMPNCENKDPMPGPKTDLLVLIDQHAADERTRVENLLVELCTPLSEGPTHSSYRSKLGHKSLVGFSILEKPLQFSISSQERECFITHAATFGAWGILFDILISQASTRAASTAEKEHHLLSVTTLPPSISERCKTDPKLLISFLRAAVWKYVEDPYLLPISEELHPKGHSEEDNASPIWLKRLSSCPQGLLDLINSRACRSAIMFNDELSIRECEELLAKLSKCVFPFMCAHGRPSMVPLIDMGEKESSRMSAPGLGLSAELLSPTAGGNSFINAYKRWK